MNADAVEDLIEDMEEATFVSETVEESVLAEMVDNDLTAERLVQMVIRVQRAYRLATYVYRNFGPTLFVDSTGKPSYGQIKFDSHLQPAPWVLGVSTRAYRSSTTRTPLAAPSVAGSRSA